MLQRYYPMLFLLMAGFIVFFYAKPTYGEIRVLLEEKKRFDEVLDQAKKLITLRDELLNRMNSIDPTQLDRLSKMLPDHVDNVRLIIEVDNIAARYGMSLKGLSFSKPNLQVSTQTQSAAAFGNQQAQAQSGSGLEDSPQSQQVTSAPKETGVGSVEFNFTVAASYDVVLAFLRDLERSLRIADIVVTSLGAGKIDFYDTKIVIKTFWLR